jgi:hypothetical protein
MSDYFEWCKKAWINKWATEADLQIWAQANKITQDEYNTIITTPQMG